MIQTKNWFLNTSTVYNRSEEPLFDKGYSLSIPANDVYSTGWIFEKPNTWGAEHKLITRPDPEFFAPGGVIRSNVLPAINPQNPMYMFDRANYTFDVMGNSSSGLTSL